MCRKKLTFLQTTVWSRGRLHRQNVSHCNTHFENLIPFRNVQFWQLCGLGTFQYCTCFFVGPHADESATAKTKHSITRLWSLAGGEWQAWSSVVPPAALASNLRQHFSVLTASSVRARLKHCERQRAHVGRQASERHVLPFSSCQRPQQSSKFGDTPKMLGQLPNPITEMHVPARCASRLHNLHKRPFPKECRSVQERQHAFDAGAVCKQSIQT